jgi:hypothetical protein
MQHFTVKVGELFVRIGMAPNIGRAETFDIPAKDQPQAEAKAYEKYQRIYGLKPMVLRTLYVGLGRNVKRGDRRQIAEAEARLNAKWFIATGRTPERDSAFSWTAIPKSPEPASVTQMPRQTKAPKEKKVRVQTPKTARVETPKAAKQAAQEPEQMLPASWIGVRTETTKVDREANTF